MHWVALLEKDVAIDTLEKRFGDAAHQPGTSNGTNADLFDLRGQRN
jgi:hypothetical protein